jgi:DNA polymerase-1
VGEKTATKLVQEFGSIEQLMRRTDELKGKLKDSIEAAGEQLALNKDLAQLKLDLDLEIGPEDCVMGEWDVESVRSLFTSLEFRTLFERLEEVGRSAKPAVELAELDLREADPAEVAALLSSDAPKAIRPHLEGRELRGIAVSAGGGQAAYAGLNDLGLVADALSDPTTPKWAHDAKDTRPPRCGGSCAWWCGLRHDARGLPAGPGGTELRAGSAVPAVPRHRRRGLGPGGGRGTAVRRLVADPCRRGGRGRSPRARPHRAPRQGGLRQLLEDVELPLSSVLARMQAIGVALDVGYLTRWRAVCVSG